MFPVSHSFSVEFVRMSEENKRKDLPPPAFPRVIREHVRDISVGSAAVDDLSTSSMDAPKALTSLRGFLSIDERVL